MCRKASSFRLLLKVSYTDSLRSFTGKCILPYFVSIYDNIFPCRDTADGGHLCTGRKPLILKSKPCSRTDDTGIYTTKGFYEIEKIIDKDAFLARPIPTCDYTSQVLQQKWNLVGVFTDLAAHSDLRKAVVIQRKDILGKLLRTNGILVTLPKEWLNYC